MAWTIASIIIHPETEQYGGRIDANYAIQDVLDATDSVVSYYGAKSQMSPIQFLMLESENSSVALSTLIAAAQAGTTVALVGNPGALGNFKIISFSWNLVQALNQSGLVYKCNVELVKV